MFYLLNHASKSRSIFTIGFLASRSSKLDPMLVGFDELLFTKKPDKKTEPGACFFSFPKEECQCLLQNHTRASRESKTATLVEGKKTENTFFPFPKGTAVTLAKAQPCLS